MLVQNTGGAAYGGTGDPYGSGGTGVVDSSGGGLGEMLCCSAKDAHYHVCLHSPGSRRVNTCCMGKMVEHLRSEESTCFSAQHPMWQLPNA